MVLFLSAKVKGCKMLKGFPNTGLERSGMFINGVCSARGACRLEAGKFTCNYR